MERPTIMTQYTNLFIPDGAGESVALPGIETTIKVTSASTGGAFAIFEEVTSPGAGPALHVHAHHSPFAQSIFNFLNFKLSVEGSTQPQPLQDVLLQF